MISLITFLVISTILIMNVFAVAGPLPVAK